MVVHLEIINFNDLLKNDYLKYYIIYRFRSLLLIIKFLLIN